MNKHTTEKYKIAVVEDNQLISKSLSGELVDEDFAVVKAYDGVTGLALILKEEPDLVLLDIVMPEMDGMTMLAKLRASNEYGRHVPVIILTNLNAEGKIIDGITKNEPSYYLIKSNFTMADITDKVRNCLTPTQNLSSQ